jgi:hypothetical protein
MLPLRAVLHSVECFVNLSIFLVINPARCVLLNTVATAGIDLATFAVSRFILQIVNRKVNPAGLNLILLQFGA